MTVRQMRLVVTAEESAAMGGFGDGVLDALRVGERPDPDVQDGWVAVSVRAASLNMHDLWTLRGVGIKTDAGAEGVFRS